VCGWMCVPHLITIHCIHHQIIANEVLYRILKFLQNYRCYNRCLSGGWPGSPMIWVSTVLYYYDDDDDDDDDDDCIGLCSYLMGWVGCVMSCCIVLCRDVVLWCIVLY
jgi:hypothetical protein